MLTEKSFKKINPMQLLKMLSDYEHDFYSSGEIFKADMGGARLRSESECRLKT